MPALHFYLILKCKKCQAPANLVREIVVQYSLRLIVHLFEMINVIIDPIDNVYHYSKS